MIALYTDLTLFFAKQTEIELLIFCLKVWYDTTSKHKKIDALKTVTKSFCKKKSTCCSMFYDVKLNENKCKICTIFYFKVS